MLAAQAARGIEGFYREILDDLDLPRRAGVAVSRAVAGQLAWEQLRGRATRIFEVEGQVLSDVVFDHGEDHAPAAKLLNDARVVLLSIKSPIVAPATVLGPADPMLVVLPVDANPLRMLVAIVPTRAIVSRFLNVLNQPENMSAFLLTENLRIVSAEDRSLVEGTLGGIRNPAVSAMILKELDSGVRVSREVRSIELGGTRMKVDPVMVTLQPVDLRGQKRWWLVVSSSLVEADQAVGRFLRRSIIGALLVILTMTGVLVSTSVQTIRARGRLER